MNIYLNITSNKMITAIILNFNRPDYLKNTIIPKLLKIELISEILISHGKEKTYFNIKYNDKVKHLKHWDLNEEYGLSLRFLTSEESTNDTLLIMDDDILPTKETIKTLYESYLKEPNRIHGIYGRELDKNNNYTTKLCEGDCDIILTRLLICNKEMCKNFLLHRTKFEEKIVKYSKPFWNGEDIIFNLINIKYNKVYGKAFKLSHSNLFDFKGISTDTKHLNYRNEITLQTIKELELNIKKDKKNVLSSNFLYELKNSKFYVYITLLFFLIFCLFLYKKYWKN